MQLLAGHPTVQAPETFLDGVRGVAAEDGLAVQAFDARYVAGREHLERAVALARRERERGDGIADSLAIEVLCYAAGRRQISDALAMGVDESTAAVVVALVPDDPEAARGRSDDRSDGTSSTPVQAVTARLEERFDLADPSTDAEAEEVLEATEASLLCDFFEISTAERDAAVAELSDLVGERVALLVVQR